MSHVTVIKTEIKDLKALAKACINLGLELRPDQKEYKWYQGARNKCDAAVVVPDNDKAYELGLVKNGETYQFETDNWQGGYGLFEKIGTGGQTLINEYTKTVAIDQASAFAKANGWSVNQEYNEETNETVIKLRKY
jgi:hypothetical protein